MNKRRRLKSKRASLEWLRQCYVGDNMVVKLCQWYVSFGLRQKLESSDRDRACGLVVKKPIYVKGRRVALNDKHVEDER